VSARLVVFVARDCHLCELALARLEPLRAELGFELEAVEITGVPKLEARHRRFLPVGELDGARLFEYRVDEPALRAALAGGAAQPG
jgi:hypothetical protein